MKGFLVLFTIFAVLLAADAQSKRCREAEDCDEGECCVVHSVFGLRRGECRALATEGNDCNHADASLEILGGKYLLICPCAPGLKCQDETKDLPILGEVVIASKCVVDDGTEPETEVPEEE